MAVLDVSLTLRTAIASALSGISYNSAGVPFVDAERDDSGPQYVYMSQYEASQDDVKDSRIQDVRLSLTVAYIQDYANFGGMQEVDDIGGLILNALESKLDLSPNFSNIVQLFERSTTDRQVRGQSDKYMKTLDFLFKIEEL